MAACRLHGRLDAADARPRSVVRPDDVCGRIGGAELMRRAGAAMYASKPRGRNRAVTYSPEVLEPLA